jgi:hypothetical protein
MRPDDASDASSTRKPDLAATPSDVLTCAAVDDRGQRHRLHRSPWLIVEADGLIVHCCDRVCLIAVYTDDQPIP